MTDIVPSRYKNPWHKPKDTSCGPEFYTTYAKAKEYRGYLIYERIDGAVWDVVKDGVCLTQMAGPNGARRAIDAILIEAQTAEIEEPQTPGFGR